MPLSPLLHPLRYPATHQGFSVSPTIGVLSTHPPTRCGLATFSSALSDGLRATGATVSTVRIADGSTTEDPGVVGELTNGSASSVAAAAELLNRCDLALIQHEYGIYGGADGDEVVDILRALRVPSIVVAHTVLNDPTPHQRWVLETIAAEADQVVVMSAAANDRLIAGYDVDRRKVTMIPHGAAVATDFRVRRAGRPTLLTWGLLGPGKGIERVIDAMPSLQGLPGRPRYVVAGRTHPKVLAAEGEAYRESLRERARSLGVADAVNLETGYLGADSLRTLIQSAAAVVLPYDSTQQVTSGVLVEAIAKGRPVVATAFPHAVELLSSGAGIVVNHQDQDALAAALRQVLTQPGLAGAMAGEARQLGPSMDWPVVAKLYLVLAQRLCASRSALL